MISGHSHILSYLTSPVVQFYTLETDTSYYLKKKFYMTALNEKTSITGFK